MRKVSNFKDNTTGPKKRASSNFNTNQQKKLNTMNQIEFWYT